MDFKIFLEQSVRVLKQISENPSASCRVIIEMEGGTRLEGELVGVRIDPPSDSQCSMCGYVELRLQPNDLPDTYRHDRIKDIWSTGGMLFRIDGSIGGA